MTAALLILRAIAALVLGDPAAGVLPLLAVAALGLTAVAVAVVVARLLAAVLAAVLGLGSTGVSDRTTVPDLVARIGWSHPDADGHVRSRAPGAMTPA
ncbi:DUF6412 domain-containing protein [Curtobacterium sp. VKM Ac-1376]|uniref:DUF6412 domain-containing protein n=1 Tax=Curtobacterium sp. VKM Ac-1376 TaxID=123312 RepID=UPI00188C89D7|nr:DUF6412 domain-containing protein [Curtobacterium sp. VKM Ac-1376]MBF4614951.1 hypothetical protein [Curtobacterium sp. VKM Ac-1376]